MTIEKIKNNIDSKKGNNVKRKQKGKQKVYDEIVRIRKEHKKNN